MQSDSFSYQTRQPTVERMSERWIDLTLNPEAVTWCFPDGPSLNYVEIEELTFSNGCSNINLHFNVEEFPSNPPKKWRDDNDNCVQITLNIVADKLKVNRNSSGFFNGNLQITKSDKYILVRFHADTGDIDIHAEAIRISRVSAYCDSRRLNKE